MDPTLIEPDKIGRLFVSQIGKPATKALDVANRMAWLFATSADREVRDPAMAVVFTCFALLFFYKIHVQPFHFWMDRRFLVVILPCALLFAAAAALG